jgi:hypothetical protein
MSSTDVKASKMGVQAPVTESLDMEQSHSETYIDPVIERRTVRKLDLVVLGCFGIMYLLANLDRNNLVSHHRTAVI